MKILYITYFLDNYFKLYDVTTYAHYLKTN